MKLPWLPQYLQLPEAQRQEFITTALKDRLANIDTDPDAMLDSIFLNAVNIRNQGSNETQDHIYLKQFEIPQIVLFDILINKLPFVTNAHAITNKAIVRALQGVKNAVLLDVGIGRGLQTARLLEMLKANSSLETLTIIGIELWEEAIIAAEKTISEAAAEVPFKTAFIPIISLMEELDPEILKASLPLSAEQLIVNSSLTLHHMPSQQLRTDFFNLMKEIGADRIFLTEPDSDHYTSDWQRRLQSAYAHYKAVFRVIDQLDITPKEKNGLKMFFGREIDDVVGNAEDQRFEKHEPGAHWVAYLEAAGFTPAAFKEIPADMVIPPVQFEADEKGFLSIRHNEVGVLALVQGAVV